MKKRILSILVTFTIVMSLTACGDVPQEILLESEGDELEPKEEVTPIVESVEEADITSSVDAFNADLLNKKSNKESFFYSPYSILSALGLLNLGASDKTREELNKVMHIQNYQGFKEAYKKQSYPSSIKIANGIWVNRQYLSDTFDEDAAVPAEEYFKATVTDVDFLNDLKKIHKEIHNFVKDNTDGFIDDYESISTKDTQMDIVNTTYFKGKWNIPFDKKNTKKEDFHGVSGDKKVSMMYSYNNDYHYYKDDNITALELPYEDDMVMDILIPTDKSKNILDLVKSKDKTLLNSVIDTFRKDEGWTNENIRNLVVPKLNMDVTYDNLKQDLFDLGLETAFTTDANFENFGQVYASNIMHRAKVKVDEKGTEAAGVTEITMELTAVADEEKEYIDFIVDCPYIFVIRDNSESSNNGIVYFTGYISDLGGK